MSRRPLPNRHDPSARRLVAARLAPRLLLQRGQADVEGAVGFGEALAAGRRGEGLMRDIRGREISMIFQNPRAALNPIRKIGRQIEVVLLQQPRAADLHPHGRLSLGHRPRHALPRRSGGELDNRGSHFWLARYWAEALADGELKDTFAPVAEKLAANSDQIEKELLEVQGSPVDLGGYYFPDEEKTTAVMRPSATFNEIIDAI